MKVIIAGSRTAVSYQSVVKAVQDSGFDITEIISGGAQSAGYRRNEKMAQYGEAVIALWDGESRGTAHMIELAKRMKLAVYVFITKEI